MKKLLLVPVMAVLAAQPVFAQVGFDMNINIGNGGGRAAVPVPVPVAPVPVVDFVVEEPPEFIVPSALGFYVAVGVPYDMFYVSNRYYVYRNNTWYYGPGYNGPWTVTSYRRLPPGLRRHKHERIRYIRDEEYRRYRDDGDHYRGRHFRPNRHEEKEHRKEMRERMKEERKWEKEERKWEKHERKHGRHDDD